MIRILIADDHGLIRGGLRALLNDQSDFEIIGEAVDGSQALALASALQPDVVLMDISMPQMGGIESTLAMKQAAPQARVLVLSVHEDEGLVREAIRAGARGYIIKRAVIEELVSAVRAVARGEIYIHPAMTSALLKDLLMVAVPCTDELPPAEALTPRELQVLRLLARGYTNRQIAEELHISVRTVDGHRANLTDKLGLRSRVELVEYAQKQHLIS